MYTEHVLLVTQYPTMKRVTSLLLLFVLCCGEGRFFDYAANKELEQVNLSKKNGARSHVWAGEGQEVRRAFQLHSNLSLKRRIFVITTYPFDLTLLTPPSAPPSANATRS